MQCFPLYSLLLSLGSPRVNLLVLDVEGAETLILRTVPWDLVDIEVSRSWRTFKGKNDILISLGWVQKLIIEKEKKTFNKLKLNVRIHFGKFFY
jgi:hypothetical protein